MKAFFVAIALMFCVGYASAQTPTVTFTRDAQDRVITLVTVDPVYGQSVIDFQYVDELGQSTGDMPYFIRLNNGPWVKIPEPSKWVEMGAQMRSAHTRSKP